MEPNYRGSGLSKAMRDELADRQLILSGQFKDEIAALEKLKAECDAKMGIVTTLEDAEKVKAFAEEDAKQTKLEADKVLDAARAALAKAQEDIASRKAAQAQRELSFSDEVAQFQADKAQLRNDQAKHEQDKAALATDWASLNKVAEGHIARAEELRVEADALDAKAADLAKREQAYNARLDALRIS